MLYMYQELMHPCDIKNKSLIEVDTYEQVPIAYIQISLHV